MYRWLQTRTNFFVVYNVSQEKLIRSSHIPHCDHRKPSEGIALEGFSFCFVLDCAETIQAILGFVHLYPS